MSRLPFPPRTTRFSFAPKTPKRTLTLLVNANPTPRRRNRLYHTCSWMRLWFSLGAFVIGAGLMALLGKWA